MSGPASKAIFSPFPRMPSEFDVTGPQKQPVGQFGERLRQQEKMTIQFVTEVARSFASPLERSFIRSLKLVVVLRWLIVPADVVGFARPRSGNWKTGQHAGQPLTQLRPICSISSHLEWA